MALTDSGEVRPQRAVRQIGPIGPDRGIEGFGAPRIDVVVDRLHPFDVWSKPRLPAEVSASEIIRLIEKLNADVAVHGILVQLPLPAHHDIQTVLRTIAMEKDVDGFHLYNVGGLVLGETVFPPCTPYGVVKLLD